MLARRTAKNGGKIPFVKKHSAEYCRRSGGDQPAEGRKRAAAVPGSSILGRGRILISQIAADGGYGKSVRLYTGILDRGTYFVCQKSFRTGSCVSRQGRDEAGS